MKGILDKLRSSCKGQKEMVKSVYPIFNKETDYGRKTDKYNKLLEDVIKSIIEIKE